MQKVDISEIKVLKDDITGWSAPPVKKASHEEMAKMFMFLEEDQRGWISDTFCKGYLTYRHDLLKDVMLKALRFAERPDIGECWNGTLVLKDEPHNHIEKGCMTWKIFSNGYFYRVHYITDELDVHADSLTEEMMDDLLIEGPYRVKKD